MQYTVYLDKIEGVTRDESPIFEAIFSGAVTFIADKFVHVGNGIHVIPRHDNLRIVEVSRVIEVVKDECSELVLAPKWNDNMGRQATGREIFASVIQRSQDCLILTVFSRFDGEKELR